MKKFTLLVAVLIGSITVSLAQRLAYVDSEYILRHIPEYVAAQKKLDDLSTQWQEEVDKKYGDIERLYKAYQNDQVLLNDDMRRRREDEIVQKEKEVKDFQRKKFGYEGELFQERVRLVNPVQERVAKAIQDIANAQGLDIILDKGSEVTFLFANPKLDKSDEIITKLGFKPDPSLSN